MGWVGVAIELVEEVERVEGVSSGWSAFPTVNFASEAGDVTNQLGDEDMASDLAGV